MLATLSACGGGQDPVLGFDGSAPAAPGSLVAPQVPLVGGVAVALGAATTFGAFGGSAGVTNQGTNTVVNADLGTTGASTLITGFHDGLAPANCVYTETPLNVGTLTGTNRVYTAPPAPVASGIGCAGGTAATFTIATQARADALAAYNELVAKPGGPDPGAGNLANLTLAPGVYTAAAGTFRIQGGNLTLDAQGNPDAVWVFQTATSLSVGGPGAAFPASVILTNGALARNVYWQVGSAATLNAAGGGTFNGTLISQSGGAISTPGNMDLVTINGRILSLNASVTMVNTVITLP